MSKPCRSQPGRRRGSTHGAPGHDTGTDDSTRAHLPAHNQTCSPVPQGVCMFYWSKGQCEKEDCQFSHIRSQSESTSQPSLTTNSGADFPFLTDEGLAEVTGCDFLSSCQPANPLRPGQVQNKLKRFLADDFHFRKTSDIYTFFTLIDSAVSANLPWVCVTFAEFLGPV